MNETVDTSATTSNDWNWGAQKSSFDAAGAFTTATGDRARVDYDSDYKRNLNYDISANKMNITTGSTSQPPYTSPNTPSGWNGTGTPGSWNGGYPSTSIKIEGYDVVGIKAKEIPEIQSEIRKYVDKVQSTLDQCLNANATELNKAIRGSVLEESVNDYIRKVKLYCQNVTSDLLAFSDKLADVGNAWIAATNKMASSISSGTKNYAAGSAYKETNTYNGNIN